MTGIIVSTPPTVEVPPGNNASNPSSLPAVTYQYALLNIPQTWTALQTFGSGLLRATSPNITTPIGITFADLTGTLTATISGSTITNSTIASSTITTSTFNGNTWTAGTGILTIAAAKTATHNATTIFAGVDGKTLTINNSLALAGVDSKVLTVNNSLTLAGTDGTTMTFPTTSATLARTDAANTFTGTQTIGALVATTLNGNTWTAGTGILTIAAAKTLTANNSLALAGVDGKTLTVNNSLTLAGADATTMTFPASSDTVVTLAATQALTNKTLNGNTFTTGTGTLTFTGTKTLTVNNSVALTGTDSSTLNYGVGGTLTGSSSSAIWYDNIPQNSQSAAYQLVLSDAQKHILHPSADTTARTFTIPANGTVAFPIGTAVTFVNQNAAGVITIAITTDTMRLASAGTTGSRTLAANGIATAMKITATEWIISGTGLT